MAATARICVDFAPRSTALGGEVAVRFVNAVASGRVPLTFGTYTVRNVNGTVARPSRLTKCTASPTAKFPNHAAGAAATQKL
jgi:hypothetical protein